MDITKCNVAWETPSENSLGSMPLGNGELGANVWAEADGRVHLLLSRTDAWDEYHRLLKLGSLTLTCDGPLREWLRAGFRHGLRLEDGTMRIALGAPGDPALALRLWADAYRDVLWIEAAGPPSTTWTLELGTWRTAYRELGQGEAEASMKQDGELERAFEYPDAVLEATRRRANQIGLYHRNRYSMLGELLTHQELPELVGQVDDPLVNRTFGCLAEAHGADAVETDGALVRETLTARAEDGAVVFGVVAHCERADTLGEWSHALAERADEARAVDLEAAREAHARAWAAFWERSFIDVTGDEAAEAVTRAYQLQRYVTACAGRGDFPIKFNGSIFTMEGPPKKPRRDAGPDEMVRYNADFRNWGGGYWFQNTRLIYWPLLASGDWPEMEPWFRLFERAAETCRYRVGKFLGMEGLFFPETMTMWGTYRNDNFGQRGGRWARSEDLSAALAMNRYIRRYWQGGLELAAMMLAYRSHAGADAWWIHRGYPLVRDLLAFYRAYYTQRDAEGRIRFEPSQSLETWWDAANPTPEIAGLAHVLDGLLALPEELLPAADRPFFEGFRQELPPLPVGVPEGVDGEAQLLPAERYAERNNMENCELYAVFPYPVGALGTEHERAAQRAYERRSFPKVFGWHQNPVQAAMLGRAEEAADMVTAALAPSVATDEQRAWLGLEQHPEIRFPGFFGPNMDWVPDQDHGSVNALALQKMALQTHEGKLRVLPAWPERWNVHFRLHAPDRTTVEVRAEGGRITDKRVTPASREADVIGEPVRSA